MSRATFSLLLLLLLSFMVALGLNSLIAILHELGHYVTARLVASATLTVITQTDTFPPIVWVTGRVTYVGELGSARALFFLAPAFTTLPPAILAAWWARRGTSSQDRIALRNGFFFAWILEALFTLLPSFNSSAGASDGAFILGRAGIEFAMTNPIGLFLASYPGWIVFRLSWWITAVYIASRIFFAKAQLSLILIFSLASFTAIGLILYWIGLP